MFTLHDKETHSTIISTLPIFYCSQYQHMSPPPGSTDPIKKSSSADHSEDEDRETLLDPVSHPDNLSHDRMGSSVLPESAGHPNNNATTTNTAFVAGTLAYNDPELHNAHRENDPLYHTGSLMPDPMIDFLHDNESNHNPFSLDLEERMNNTPFANNQYTHGEGAVSEENYYERPLLYSLYSHGSCASQSHDESLDRKPAARDSTHFRNDSSFSQVPNKRTYPIQAANNRNRCSTSDSMSVSSTSTSPSASFDSASNKLIQGRQGKAVKKLKPPPVSSLPQQRSGRSSLGKEIAETRTSNLKTPPVASLPQQGRRHSQRQVNQTKKSKKPKAKAKAPPKGTKHTQAKTRISRKTRVDSRNDTSADQYMTPQGLDISTMPPAHQQMMNQARTSRKQEALLTWFRRLKDLLHFRDENGHTNVPQQYSKNHPLGIWVNKQRMEKKAKDGGKPTSMTDDKAQLLEDVGFVWAKRKGQAAWEEKFHELQGYWQKTGNCNVPTKNKTNRALGRWVSTQRSNYKKFKRTGSTAHPRMDREEMKRRIRRLDGINFSWSLLPGSTLPEENVDDSSDSSSSSAKTTENDQNDAMEEDNENPSGSSPSSVKTTDNDQNDGMEEDNENRRDSSSSSGKTTTDNDQNDDMEEDNENQRDADGREDEDDNTYGNIASV